MITCRALEDDVLVVIAAEHVFGLCGFLCSLCGGLLFGRRLFLGRRIFFSSLVLGSVVLGSVVLGSVVLGSVVLGSVVLGSVILGSVILGSVILGSVALGSVVLGSVVLLRSLGLFVVGLVLFGSFGRVGSLLLQPDSLFSGSVALLLCRDLFQAVELFTVELVELGVDVADGVFGTGDNDVLTGAVSCGVGA
jgi:hypothetical protein